VRCDTILLKLHIGTVYSSSAQFWPSAYLLSTTHSKDVRFLWVTLYISRTKYSLAIFLKDLVLPRISLLQTIENDGAINLNLQDDGILFTKFMIVELVRNHLRGLTALIVKVSVVWDVTPCILVDNYRRLLGRSHIGRYLRNDCRGMTTECGAQTGGGLLRRYALVHLGHV